jgi:hypothetical protein
VVTFPSVVSGEQSLVIRYDGAACLNYWRAGVALSNKPDAAPVAPLGCLIVAYITQSGCGGPGARWPMRIFYLSCLAAR